MTEDETLPSKVSRIMKGPRGASGEASGGSPKPKPKKDS